MDDSLSLPLKVVAPADLAPFATGGGSPAESSPRDDSTDSADINSAYEQSAAAALLGLHSAWPSSPDDEAASDLSLIHI